MSYTKGIDAERQLLRLLKDRDYEANRSVGSRGAADIHAAKKTMLGFRRKKFVIQVKSTSGDKTRISKNEVKKLRKYADKVNMTAVLAVRFSRERWRFWNDEDDAMLKSRLRKLESTKKDQIDLVFNNKSARRFEKVF